MTRQGLMPLLLAGAIALTAAIGGAPARTDGAGAVLRTARVGTQPRAIAIDTATGRAFVANYGGNSVSMLDARTGRVLRTIPLAASSHPRRIAVDERSGHVFVESVGPLDSNGALTGSGAVAMLGVTTGAVLGSTAIGRGPLALAVDSRTSRVFAANYDDNTVSLLSAITGHLLGTANVGNSPIAFAVDALRGHVFVANKYGNSVSVLNAANGAVMRTFGVCDTPHELAMDSLRNRLAVACWGPVDDNDNPKGKGSLDLVSATSGLVASKVRVGIYPWAVATDRQTGRVFVANWGPLDKTGSPTKFGTINAIDTATGRVLRSPTVGYGPGPLAVDLGHDRVYVANSSTVSVLDAANGRLLGSIAVGLDVEDVAVDGAANRLFAVNAHDGTVSVIDTAAL